MNSHTLDTEIFDWHYTRTLINNITIYSHRKEDVYFHIALFPEAKLDFVTKLSHIHGNIMRTNHVTGNSTCCLGDMAVSAPEAADSGAFTAILPSQTG